MSKPNGGPAFPQCSYNMKGGYDITGGMTLRDYFAAKAMGATFYPAIMESIRTDEDLDCLKVAEFAYEMADAMLKVRDEK